VICIKLNNPPRVMIMSASSTCLKESCTNETHHTGETHCRRDRKATGSTGLLSRTRGCSGSGRGFDTRRGGTRCGGRRSKQADDSVAAKAHGTIGTYPAAGVEVPLATVVPLDAPPSFTVVLRQEVSLPDMMVTMSEYAVVPVLSLRAMLLDPSQPHVSKNPTKRRVTHKIVLA
jgi:hypothetical protein